MKLRTRLFFNSSEALVLLTLTSPGLPILMAFWLLIRAVLAELLLPRDRHRLSTALKHLSFLCESPLQLITRPVLLMIVFKEEGMKKESMGVSEVTIRLAKMST